MRSTNRLARRSAAAVEPPTKCGAAGRNRAIRALARVVLAPVNLARAPPPSGSRARKSACAPALARVGTNWCGILVGRRFNDVTQIYCDRDIVYGILFTEGFAVVGRLPTTASPLSFAVCSCMCRHFLWPQIVLAAVSGTLGTSVVLSRLA